MKSICAIVSGRVIQCLRLEGDQVQPGDEVLKIESMKMEIPVETEISGCIAKWLVKEGDDVQEGQVVAELS
ncbi:acetyl-CoA carboxylase biotin carboxyl carrier protein subunit [Noviherbaspirillum sp. Root189]|uniref:acetyl-CoA carboxylase biotin carboxyl carrier protein subunit n=1 Tax=Noviherbaspirillum sp. Root189 TaxID=1736487 RepID=UPI000710DB9A|nr:acetyl-CoA carboxylase biotin carboxyl carrier protein subunit [Noviherbaspirillum sp. Root189]KRB67942.1 biotin attachment protein [Noviherbaspirillum sp. Root189]